MMGISDMKYFSGQASGADNGFDWEDPYVDDFDYDDNDPMFSFDDEIVPEFDDEFLDDDTLDEEE